MEEICPSILITLINGSDYVGFVTPGGQADQVLELDNIGENLTEKDSLVITNYVACNDGG